MSNLALVEACQADSPESLEVPIRANHATKVINCAKPLPEDLGDELLHFYPHPQREKLGGFLVANFLSFFPKEKWLKICHSQNFRNVHHIFPSKERLLSPGTHSGGDFT